MNKLSIKLKWQVLRTRLYLEKIYWKNFRTAAVLLILLVGSLLACYNLWGAENIWYALAAANGNALHFCELNRIDALIKQPSNTWSNLAYIPVGLAIVSLGFADLRQGMERRKCENFLVRYPIFSIIFGFSTLYVGLGSFLYHASLTSYFQKHDQMGMYALVLTILAFSVYRIFPTIKLFGKWRSFHSIGLVLAGIFFVYIFAEWSKININTLFPILIISVFALHIYYEIFIKKSVAFSKYMLGGFACLAMGYIIWMLDRSHVVCSPESWFQGHAVWHILTAASALLVYMYYRTDTAPVPEKLNNKV
ncbi:MAG: ceramidase [Chitinophagales bacterium]|nr:ceramidase domain-containing protein [Chitinophagales bacterium]MCO5280307.1 ceramidase [Chitinophagales bacterium]OJV26455.1 MAG: hypothetical protein BGO32_12725 [Bacteroidetes bacterium 37-13]HRN93681.1 ceramidase domain-containing protein [Chitinophagales bacterium]HRP39474.1 ceramidase domain-containing protein [Chitinophagales bacterium]